MPQIVDSIYIAAPPDVVWAITTDIERWPEWTPTVTSATRLDSGPLRTGSVARLKQPLQPPATWTVVELGDGRKFAWETRRPGMRMVGTHEMSPEGTGTRNVLRLEASGVLSRLLWPVLSVSIRQALAAENRGLKRRCEAPA